MNEPDTAAILPNDLLSAASLDDQLPDSDDLHDGEAGVQSQTTGAAGRPVCPPPVSVEPVLFLSMFSVALQAPLYTQYLWDRISEDLGYNGSKGSDCVNSSVPPDPLQKVGRQIRTTCRM